MLIYAVDDEYLSLCNLEDAIRCALPDADLHCFERSRALLKAAADTPPDIAFLDIEMPGLNGIELAQQLKTLKKDINIIFVTGYDCYMADAMRLFASGYVLKPVEAAAVTEQIENLRHPVCTEKSIFVQTFGNFTIFKNHRPVIFRYTKSKELLAYLVDRKGAVVSRRELDAVLFEDGSYSRREQKMLSRYVEELEKDLAAAEISEIFVRENNGYHVVPECFFCDLYAYLDGTGDILYTGEYMEEYSWGENLKGSLDLL